MKSEATKSHTGVQGYSSRQLAYGLASVACQILAQQAQHGPEHAQQASEQVADQDQQGQQAQQGVVPALTPASLAPAAGLLRWAVTLQRPPTLLISTLLDTFVLLLK